ncbi:hypothetical protein [Nitrosomonas sp. Nm33]|uniref:hypothetical protein n=1 Tax=Nitrosomonas sp. Nm33 TaxID=133724 RepID=UPI00089A03C3|nr:hypothetical protein [Nitrosomonas sp. Nm33]SDY04172.1 hypothetical protein SAMN05421755_100581 [Nitrosomonas sp. Nm33]
MKKNKFKISILALATATLLGIGQSVLAHTRLEVPIVTEGVRVTNNVAIGHGCGEKAIIGTSVVFPDGTDSTITVGGQPHNGPLTDFVSNWGSNVQPLQTRAVFDFVDEKQGPTGNVVGFWSGGGSGMPAHMNAFVPFRVSATNIEPTSCAKSVKFFVSIVDICEISGIDALRNGSGESGGVANLWTHNNLGTPYDRVSAEDDGPASLTINRDLTKNPLPGSCNGGVDVEIKPSAAQINRDMPIKFNGQQVWPE